MTDIFYGHMIHPWYKYVTICGMMQCVKCCKCVFMSVCDREGDGVTFIILSSEWVLYWKTFCLITHGSSTIQKTHHFKELNCSACFSELLLVFVIVNTFCRVETFSVTTSVGTRSKLSDCNIHRLGIYLNH